MPTVHLALPFLYEGQARKEVTYNEAISMLDAFVLCRVLDKDLTAPPASPVNGDIYLVPASATGAWVSADAQIAFWLTSAGAWQFFTMLSGAEVWVDDEKRPYRFDGTNWKPAYGFLAMSSADTITASATQTQVGATALTTQCARLTTVATVGDSVKLAQAAVVGAYSEVLNAGANAAWIWPITGDAIDAAAANARDANALAAAGVRRYRCFTAGVWRTI
jgi:hypothetical protein